MGEWREARLGEIGTVVGGGTPSREVAIYWDGDIPWLTPGELTGNRDKYVANSKECISDLGLSVSGARLVPKGSLLITSRASIGSCALAGRAMATNQGFKNLIPGEDVDPDFLFHLGQTLSQEMTRRASGTTFLEISTREFERIVVWLPPLEEQRRIAEVLDTIDEIINTTEQIISKLKLQEHGMKKDLFRKRHDSDTSWEQISVGELGRVITGGTPPTADNRYWNGTVPFVTPGDIDSRDNALVTERSVTELGAALGRTVPSGSVAVVCIGSTVGKIGRISTRSVTNQQINCVVPSSDYDSEFVYHVLDLLRPSIEAEAGRQAIPIVNAKLLSSLQVWIVPFEEQKEIVARIIPIRDRIEHERLNLEKHVRLQTALADDLLSGRVRTVAA